jgi:four helix bundle protein
MEKEKTARYKSKKFAVRIVNLYKYLCEEKREYIMSKQLLKSGTSIGANLAEAEYAISDKDFLAKVYISLKESAETVYWLELLYETAYLTENQYESISEEALALLKMLKSTTKTLVKQSGDPNYTLNSKNYTL